MSTAESTAENEVNEGESEEKAKLNLDVQVTKPSTCERHVTVAISREDIERYFSESFDELVPKAELPGFRAGKAPRKLVEKQFRDRIVDQVKGKLLMDSMAQVSEECDFSAISEPDFDFDAVSVPDDGPMKFEFNIEVRPEFDMPQWKGLNLEKPAKIYDEKDIDRNLRRLLEKYGNMVPISAPAEADDLLVVNIDFKQGDQVVASLKDETVQIKKILSFNDAKIEGFDALVIGASAGDRRTAKVKISDGAENEALQGQTVDAEIEILDVKRLEMPEMNHQFLERIGGFENEEELRQEVRKELDRQLVYHQQKQLRSQITKQLTAGANWDLPQHLLKRQARRELDRAVMELRSAGFDDNVIRTYSNQLQQNSMQTTAVALKEHFILERIAEENTIEAEASDYDNEIRLIAAQTGESTRRVRSRMEKRGQIDTLRNQIVERKVINLITDSATIKEIPLEVQANETTAIDFALAASTEANIPEAKPGDEQPIPGMAAKAVPTV